MSTQNKHIVIFENDTITLTQHEIQGFWLWDKIKEMNISMRAKTEREAFVEALTYYQNRTKQIETELKEINKKVDSFLDQFRNEED